MPAWAPAAAPADGVETLELDDDELPEDAAAAVKPKPKSFDPPTDKKSKKKSKKLHVPTFERFRLLLDYRRPGLAAHHLRRHFRPRFLPKATINVSTDATNVNASLNLNLSTSATSLDASSNTIPAKLASEQKTYSQQVATTGQKNNGNKASGSVVFYNCDKNDTLSGQSETVPAGTGISNNGQTYITQQGVQVPPSHFSNNNCKSDQPSSPTPVTAQSGGAAYNVSGNSTFSVSFANPVDGSDSFAASTPDGISGGTDNIVQTVNQNDINNAKAKISTNDSAQNQFLANELKQDGYYAITTTFSAGTPVVTSSANVGDAVNNVTVTETVTYSMFGVHQSDLKTLVDNNVKGQINTGSQSILSEGLSTATFSVNSSNTISAQLAMQATAEAGPQLNTTGIKQQAAGKRPGDVKTQLETNPDVTGVNVKLSPFWVSSVPSKTSRITVVIAKPTTTASSSNATNP